MTDKAPEENSRPSPEGDAPSAPPPSPQPPRGPRTVTLIAWAAFGLLMLTAGAALSGVVRAPLVRAWDALRPTAQPAGHENAAGGNPGAVQYYTCGMHPWVILPKPGLCPICHMDLTPLDPDKFTGEVTIDPVVSQDIGVRIEPVIRGPVVRTIRTVGTVDYDETRVRDINTKVKGWIEKLYVDYLGAEVKKGDVLFDLYSPDLYEAQEEYLLAFRKQQQPRESGEGVDLLDSARTRLEYYDITPQQIHELEHRDTAAKTMALYSPYHGVVIAKHANEGMRVDEGMQVFRIADLSKVWVMVTLYEYQLPFVQVGQHAIMTLPYIPGQTFEGRVIYVYPYLDPKTRQVSVRLEFENPDFLLKPGMYASVELRSTLATERILAPRSAILDTGEREVAFVSLGEGRFQPRNVLTGVQTGGDMIEVLDGLKPGEMVVTSGQFLLDSEANIRESLARMIRGDLATEQKAVVAIAGASELKALPPAAASALTTMMDAYFDIGDTLAGDSTEAIAAQANRLADGADRLLETDITGHPHFWQEHDEVATVRGKALELAEGPDIDAARLNFADLSVALSKLLRATGVPPGYGRPVQELHCPMFRQGQGGSIWLQPEGGPRNPFFGSVMLECFDERSALPVTGQAPESESPAAPAPVSKPPAPGTGGVVLDAGEQLALDRLVAAYLAIQVGLTRDETADAGERLSAIHEAAARLADAEPTVAGPAGRIAEAAGGEATDLDALRATFEAISNGLIDLVKVAPTTDTVAAALYQVYCPMVKKSWLQASPEVANPYAPSMLRCGSVKAEYPALAEQEVAP